MKLLKAYLKDKLVTIITFAVFCLVFAAAFLLYQLPPEAVIYPIVLNMMVGIAVMGTDFIKVRNQWRELERLRHLTADMITSLPQISNVYDTEYTAISKNADIIIPPIMSLIQ